MKIKKFYLIAIIIFCTMFIIPNNVVKAASSLQPIMALETPTDNSTLTGNVNIQGWALDATGIKEVRIYVDNKFKAYAQIGITRADVNKAHPGYTNGSKSGYSAVLNRKDFSLGSHTVKVQAVGKKGIVQEKVVHISLQNKMPMMGLDTPIDNLVVTGKLNIKGWALSAAGIKSVKIYIDNKYAVDAQLGVTRTDVNKSHPGYLNGNKSGFLAALDTAVVGKSRGLQASAVQPTNSGVAARSLVSVGIHTLKVQVLGNDGIIQEKVLHVQVSDATKTEVVNCALSFIGVDYRWGGADPSGFDAAGLMQYTYAHFGIAIGRTTYDQINAGVAVSLSDLQPGDLLFFGSPNNNHHVGMYVDGGCFVEAPHTGAKVRMASLADRTDLFAARRILN